MNSSRRISLFNLIFALACGFLVLTPGPFLFASTDPEDLEIFEKDKGKEKEQLAIESDNDGCLSDEEVDKSDTLYKPVVLNTKPRSWNNEDMAGFEYKAMPYDEAIKHPLYDPLKFFDNVISSAYEHEVSGDGESLEDREQERLEAEAERRQERQDYEYEKNEHKRFFEKALSEGTPLLSAPALPFVRKQFEGTLLPERLGLFRHDLRRTVFIALSTGLDFAMYRKFLNDRIASTTQKLIESRDSLIPLLKRYGAVAAAEKDKDDGFFTSSKDSPELQARKREVKRFVDDHHGYLTWKTLLFNPSSLALSTYFVGEQVVRGAEEWFLENKGPATALSDVVSSQINLDDLHDFRSRIDNVQGIVSHIKEQKLYPKTYPIGGLIDFLARPHAVLRSYSLGGVHAFANTISSITNPSSASAITKPENWNGLSDDQRNQWQLDADQRVQAAQKRDRIFSIVRDQAERYVIFMVSMKFLDGMYDTAWSNYLMENHAPLVSLLEQLSNVQDMYEIAVLSGQLDDQIEQALQLRITILEAKLQKCVAAGHNVRCDLTPLGWIFNGGFWGHVAGLGLSTQVAAIAIGALLLIPTMYRLGVLAKRTGQAGLIVVSQ